MGFAETEGCKFDVFYSILHFFSCICFLISVLGQKHNYNNLVEAANSVMF